MRILALQPYGDGAGHFGKYTVRLCHEIGRLGHQVVLCANFINPAQYLDETPAFRLEQLGPKYAFFPFERKKTTSLLVWLLGRIWNNVAVLRRAIRLAEQERFDIVQLFSYELVSTWLSLTFRRSAPLPLPPIVIEIAAPNFSPAKHYGSRAERLWRRLQKLALKQMLGTHIQAICMNSASHVPELRRQLGLSEDFIVECVGDTREIPQTPLDKFEARRRIGLADYEGCVFLFFGTIRRDKGLEILLKAFEMLPAEAECRLVIAGMPLDWSMPDEAKCILSDPWIVTRFEYIPEDQIDAYFYASDALVLPYLGLYAGSSGPLYEACARGLPLIVSDVSEMGHITREKNLGLVVPPDDPQALAQAMRVFLRSTLEQRAAWSANGLNLVQVNSRSTIAQRFIQLHERVLSER